MYTFTMPNESQRLAEIEKRHAVSELVSESKPDLVYFFLLTVATLVTSLGISLDSEAIVIGGMLLAPFLVPIMALGLALVTKSWQAILRSLNNVLISFITVIIISALVSILFNVHYVPARQVFTRGEFSLLYLFVAFFSGIGAAYLWIKPKLSSNLAGIAVSVSLIPPLCIAGISIANFNNALAFETLLIFSANLIGILIATVLVFLFTRLSKFKKVQDQEIKKEVKETNEVKTEVVESIVEKVKKR